MAEIHIGKYSGGAAKPRVFASDSMRLHASRPWLANYLRARLDIGLEGEAGPKPGEVCTIDSAILHYNALLVGKSGSGKTRLATKLLAAQLQDGCSALVLDTSGETILNALSMAKAAGITDITLLWPGVTERGIPAWNPFGGKPEEAVGGFVDTMEFLFGASWGARMDDILRASSTILVALGLSPYDLFDFLADPDYRDRLVQEATPLLGHDNLYLRFFKREMTLLSAKQQQEQCAPITNKLRPIFSKPYLKTLLSADGDTLRLDTLWEQQRIVLVHLDENALGQDGAQILSGLLTQRMYFLMAKRTDAGTRPVVFMLDELQTQERYAGKVLAELVTKGRKSGLRLLMATQFFAQISETLREALGNTSFKAYFHLSDSDAPKVARTIMQGQKERVTRLELDSVKPTGQNPQEYVIDWTTLYTPQGEPVALADGAWQGLSNVVNKAPDIGGFLAVVEGVLEAMGVAQLYVKDSARKVWKIGDYLAGLELAEVRLTGPNPLCLGVRFPRPNVTILRQESTSSRIQALAGAFTSLPNRQALIRLQTGTPAMVAIAPIEFPPLPSPEPYLRAPLPRPCVRKALATPTMPPERAATWSDTPAKTPTVKRTPAVATPDNLEMTKKKDDGYL